MSTILPTIRLLFACALLAACAARTSGPVVHHGYTKGAVAAAWSPAGTRLAVANNRRIWTYDARTLSGQRELFVGRRTRTGFEFEERYGLGNSLVFVDERRLATAGMGAMVSIWDVGKRLLIANQRGAHVYDTAGWGVTRLRASYTRPE